MSTGDRLELTVDSLAYGGAGVGRSQGLVVLVEGGLPGDRLAVQLTHRARSFARARILEILSPSPRRLPPPCPHFFECGGCAYQSLDYEAQLEAKRRQVVDLLERLGKFPNPRVGPTVPSPLPFHYRSRMTYALPQAPGVGPGLHRRGNPRSILEVPSCLLPPEALQEAYRGVLRDLRCLEAGRRPSQIEIQLGDEDHRLLALLRGRGDPAPEISRLALRWITPEGPFSGVIWFAIHPGRPRHPEGAIRLLAGQDHTLRSLGPYRFKVPAGSFFQAHGVLATQLFEEVARRCGEVPGDILELHGGVGSLSLFLAAAGAPVLVVEGDRRAVRAARENARVNGISTIRFQAAQAGQALRRFEQEGRQFGAVVLDPPRTGLPAGEPARVARLARERILYLSCDPATLSRDLREMASGGAWNLQEVLPVDLFPQTAGVECLADLGRIAAS